MHTSAHEVVELRRSASAHAPMLHEFLTPFRPYLADDAVDEVCINQAGAIWTEGTRGWERHAQPALTFDACKHLVNLIAGYNGKSLKDRPVLSASLPSGERVQAVIPPGCEPGAVSITIRKASRISRSLEQLEDDGTFSDVVVKRDTLQGFERELLDLLAQRRYREFLHLAVVSKRNIVIAGKTGSGKTTLTKSLIDRIQPTERLITLEDVHELPLPNHPNHVHLFYSREVETHSVLSAKDALASCLRMKPDRILLAELRGDEAWEYVKAVNTGHPGSITSLHANGAYESFEQMTAFIKDSPTGAHLPADYIQKRLLATIDVVIFMHNRKVVEVFYDPESRYVNA
jgi:type IV secretion system protein VirB11